MDLFLILVVHSSFTHGLPWTLVLAFFLGLLMDVGLPLKGCLHPLIYLGVALLASMLWQNLNLHSRRYQGIFLALCTLLEGGGIWLILGLQGAEFVEGSYMLQTLAWRSVTAGLLGPVLLAALERLQQWLVSFNKIQYPQEG